MNKKLERNISMLKMRSKILVSALCGLILAIYSLQSQAAVVFSSYSETEISAYADDLLTGDSGDFYLYSDYTVIPGSGSVDDNVTLGLVSSPSALAEASASVDIAPVLIVADTTSLSGNITASAHVFSADVRNNHANAGASAIIDIDFSIDVMHSYIFDSVLMEAWDYAELNYSIDNISTGTNIFNGTLNNEDDGPLFDGNLSAGVYNLYIEAIIVTDAASDEGFGQASADFSLALTSEPAIPGVPVPAAVWLFASGLLGMIFVSRRNSFSY